MMNMAHVNPLPKPPRKKVKKELRIVLLGKTGGGKSATANVLLGDGCFESKCCPRSVTQKCQYKRKVSYGRNILIVDTPGMFDTNMKKEVIDKEIKKCVAISAPGPHAFLLVTSLTNRFTEEEAAVFREMDTMFGQHMMNYLIVVFTGRDQIDQAVDTHIAECPDELKQILKKACGGYITFNNRGNAEERDTDARTLLVRIEEVMKQNGGGHFSSEMFNEAEEIMQERITGELRMKEEALRREIEQELRAEMEEIMRKEREYFERLHEANVEHMERMKIELNAEKKRNSSKPPNATKQGRDPRPLSHSEPGSTMKGFSTEGEEATEESTENERALGDLAHKEMERIATRNKIIQQIQKVDGTERVRMQHQLADVGEQIKQLVANRKNIEEEVTSERLATNVTLESQVIREEERHKIEEEEEGTLGRFTKGIKHIGKRFLDLFK